MIASTPLALCFALVALFSAVELVWQRHAPELVSYIADREAQATHLLMNGGMAVMFAPIYAGAWAAGLQVACALAIAMLVVRIIWSGGEQPLGRAAGTVFHIVGLSAMIWAVRAMPPMPGEMAGMAMASHRYWFGLAFGALFLVDGLATAVLAALAPMAMVRMANLTAGRTDTHPLSGASPVRAVRLAAVPHVVMDAGMVLMLIPLG